MHHSGVRVFNLSFHELQDLEHTGPTDNWFSAIAPAAPGVEGMFVVFVNDIRQGEKTAVMMMVCAIHVTSLLHAPTHTSM